MPEYKFISRFYLLWTLFLCLLVSICMIINGSVPWQTVIFEEALEQTKRWQVNMGIFITLLVFMATISFEAGSKGLSWLYVFCTIALALVAFVHAWIDLAQEADAAARTQTLLNIYFQKYENSNVTPIVNNFQKRMRCCGLYNIKEMARGEKCHYVKSCCHWKVEDCTEKEVYKETCYGKAKHVIHILRLCAALGIIACVVQLSVLFVLLCGGMKYIYNLIFPKEGPIIIDAF